MLPDFSYFTGDVNTVLNLQNVGKDSHVGVYIKLKANVKVKLCNKPKNFVWKFEPTNQ